MNSFAARLNGGGSGGSSGGVFITTSTAYIQNTLTPNTSTQMFNVFLSSSLNSVVNSSITLNDLNTTNWSQWHYTPLGGGYTKSRIFAHTRGGDGDYFSLFASTQNSDPASSVFSGDTEIIARPGSSPFIKFNLWGSGTADDPDASVNFTRSGFNVSSHVNLYSKDGISPSSFTFFDAGGTGYIGFKASETITNSNTYVLPSSSGTSGQALLTNGSNSLYFGNVAAGSSIVGSTGSVAFFGNGNSVSQDNSNFYWNDTLNVLGVGTNQLSNKGIFVVNASSIQSYSNFISATLNPGVGFSSFLAGSTVSYRVYAYRNVNGTKIYSSTFSDSNSVTIGADGDTVTVGWAPVTDASGYSLIQNLNGIGFDDYYYDAGNVVTTTDDNSFDFFSWTFGTPPTSPTNFETWYNYVGLTKGYSVYGGAAFLDGSLTVGSSQNLDTSYGSDFSNTGVSTTPVKITRGSTSYPALRINGSEHSSALPSAFSLTDSLGNENVGFTSWNGGGGSGGYGSVVLSGYGNAANIRLGEMGGKNQFNSLRLGDIIFETDTAADNGRTYLLNGVGGGAFRYAWYCDYLGNCSFNGGASTTLTVPTAKIHIRAGTTGANTAPLKFTTGSLMTTPELGAVEFLTNKWYGTGTTGETSRKEFTMNDIPLRTNNILFASSNSFVNQADNFQYYVSSNVVQIGTMTMSGPLSASSISVSGQFDASTSTIRGKLTVTGAIDPISVTLSSNTQFPGTELYFQSGNGQTASTATVGTGRIRYNGSTNKWQYSENTGAYINLSTATAQSGTQYKIPTWGTTTTLIDSAITVDSGNKTLTYAPAGSTSGSPIAFRITGPTHTGLGGPGSTVIDLDVISGGDINVVGGANLDREYTARFEARSFASGGGGTTVSTAATVMITGAPTSSTGGTLSILNTYSLWVQSGGVRFDSSLIVGDGNDSTFGGNASVGGTLGITGVTTVSTVSVSQGIRISTTNASPTMGSATLVGGTVTVNTTKVRNESIIMLSNQNGAGTLGTEYISARTPGTSFTITSTNVLDTSRIGWVILEPGP